MKKTITLLLLAFLSSSLAASAATKTLNPGKINKISISTAVELHYTKGSTTQVRMEAERDNFSDVAVSTQGGLLSINNLARTYKDNSSNSVPLKVWVTAPEVTSFKATVGSSITIESSSYTVTGPLDIDISVGSKFKANTLSASTISLINNVGSSTDISALESKGNMSIKNTTGTRMDIPTVKAGGTLTFKSGPSGKTDFNTVKAQTATFSFEPSDRFTISQKIDAKSIAINGSVNANINLEGIDTEVLDVKGAINCNINLAGKADKLTGSTNQASINTSKLYAKSTDLKKRNGYESSSYYYDRAFEDSERAFKDSERAFKDSERAFKDSEKANRDTERARKDYEQANKEYERANIEYARANKENKRSQREYKRTQQATERAQRLQSNSYNYNYNTVGTAQSGSKKQTSTTLSTGTIKKVEASRSLAIYYTQGPLKPVRILTPAGREKDIKVYMEGSTLKVRVYGYSDYSVNQNTNTTDFGFQVFVQAPDVESFELSSGASMRFLNPYSSKGNLSIEAGSGCSIATEEIAVANLSLDLSSGASIRAKDLEADNLSIDQSGGSILFGNNFEANNLLSVDISAGGVCHLESVKAPHCIIDLSAGSNFESNRVTSSTINLDTSGAANATLAAINATSINVNAGSVSNVTLSGKCDNLNIIEGYISNGYNDYYNNNSGNSYYRNNYNPGRVIINDLSVANRTVTSEGRNSTSEYNYYDDSKSYTPKTEKEKAKEAVKVLRSIGLEDEAIRMTLKNSGISSDVIDSVLKNNADATKKTKKEYTEDDLVP